MTEWLHFPFSLSWIGEGNGNPLQCSCLENPRDRGAWWAAVYGVAQSWTRLKWLSSSSSNSLVVQSVKNLLAVQETQVWSLGWEDLLEKEMATHFSILAWKIPWTEAPGQLQSMGTQESVTIYRLHHHHHRYFKLLNLTEVQILHLLICKVGKSEHCCKE